MPYDDPDPEDPMELVAMELPGDKDSWREMAECFAMEFARMGWDVMRLRQLFDNPFYAGAYKAREILGEQAIREVIAEALFIYGTRRTPLDSEPEAVALVESAEPAYPPPGPCERP